MKINVIPHIAATLLLAILFTGCLKYIIKRTYTIYTPGYKDKDEVLTNKRSTTPRINSQTGKIYMYDLSIFLNEVNKGVRFIDNADSANPKIIKFIDTPGNLDIAVKGSSLYKDLYTDLLVINLSDPLQ